MRERWRWVQGIAQMTFVEAIRSRLLVCAAVVGLLANGAGLVAAGASVWSRGRFLIDIGLFAASIVGHVVACVLSTGLLSGEAHRNSEYMLLCRPVTRAQLLLGRLLGIFCVLAVLTQSMMLLTWAGLLLARAPVPATFFAASGVLSLEVFVTAALGCLFAAASGRALATTLTVLVFLSGQAADEVRLLAERKAQSALGSLLYGAYHLLPDFSRLSLRDVAAANAPSGLLAVWAVLYAIAYVSVVVGLACVVYERRATRLMS